MPRNSKPLITLLRKSKPHNTCLTLTSETMYYISVLDSTCRNLKDRAIKGRTLMRITVPYLPYFGLHHNAIKCTTTPCLAIPHLPRFKVYLLNHRCLLVLSIPSIDFLLLLVLLLLSPAFCYILLGFLIRTLLVYILHFSWCLQRP